MYSCTSRCSSFQVKNKFRLQRTVSRGVTRRQVILVPTDTMGGVPSRIWKAWGKHSFAKHQCYLEVGSLLWQERSVATGRRKIAVLVFTWGYLTSNYLTAWASSGWKDHIECAWAAASCWTKEHPFGPTTRDFARQGTSWSKRVPGKCLDCQRQLVDPCSQKMAPLPSERVSSSPAFTHVGIDFSGPLFVLWGPTSTKAYICIFASASFRMTHLDLSTNEFFWTLIRIISRRGLCSTIWSDNAKMFKSADRKIQQLFTQESSADRPL